MLPRLADTRSNGVLNGSANHPSYEMVRISRQVPGTFARVCVAFARFCVRPSHFASLAVALGTPDLVTFEALFDLGSLTLCEIWRAVGRAGDLGG